VGHISVGIGSPPLSVADIIAVLFFFFFPGRRGITLASSPLILSPPPPPSLSAKDRRPPRESLRGCPKAMPPLALYAAFASSGQTRWRAPLGQPIAANRAAALGVHPERELAGWSFLARFPWGKGLGVAWRPWLWGVNKAKGLKRDGCSPSLILSGMPELNELAPNPPGECPSCSRLHIEDWDNPPTVIRGGTSTGNMPPWHDEKTFPRILNSPSSALGNPSDGRCRDADGPDPGKPLVLRPFLGAWPPWRTGKDPQGLPFLGHHPEAAQGV